MTLGLGKKNYATGFLQLATGILPEKHYIYGYTKTAQPFLLKIKIFSC